MIEASAPDQIEHRIGELLGDLASGKADHREREIKDLSDRLFADGTEEIGNAMDRIVDMDTADERRATLERLWSEIGVMEGEN